MVIENNGLTKGEVAQQDFLTAEEVSTRLRLPLSTVYHLAKTGGLSAVQIGRSWRFPSRDLNQLAPLRQSTRNVLVVDDDAITRALVLGVLEPQGCKIVEAVSFEDGLAAARRQRFDLLLIDFKMPGRDGTDLIWELRGEYSMSQMVMITAFPDLAKLEKLFSLGALTLLSKPIETRQLLECAERILNSRPPLMNPGRQNMEQAAKNTQSNIIKSAKP